VRDRIFALSVVFGSAGVRTKFRVRHRGRSRRCAKSERSEDRELDASDNLRGDAKHKPMGYELKIFLTDFSADKILSVLVRYEKVDSWNCQGAGPENCKAGSNRLRQNFTPVCSPSASTSLLKLHHQRNLRNTLRPEKQQCGVLIHLLALFGISVGTQSSWIHWMIFVVDFAIAMGLLLRKKWRYWLKFIKKIPCLYNELVIY